VAQVGGVRIGGLSAIGDELIFVLLSTPTRVGLSPRSKVELLFGENFKLLLTVKVFVRIKTRTRYILTTMKDKCL